MKHTVQLMIITVFCAVVLTNLYAADPVSPTSAPPLEKPGWKLTFHDEFDKPLLNDLYWYPAYRTGRIEYLKRLGAKEINTGGAKMYHNPNAYYKIENGILKLIIDENMPPRLKKEDMAVSCLMTSDHRFGKTTNDYQILEKFAQKYGWFEMRCKGITGSGLYSAFWLHQTDPLDQEYTVDGRRKQNSDGVVEIDIFEQFGKGTMKFSLFFTEDAQHELSMGFDPSEDFHVYAVNWREDGVDWYVDGKVIRSYKGETPKKKMFILLALFQFPVASWAGELDPNLTYPKTFEVDYVRVYLPEEK
ncbi:MAG: glycoside hydrolase family 16 protein [Planctomycetaceae bacterium]|jgi:hypothetical protein|nr:glycoside hydrolase family 16 protein [Planctomycetaceae bacterium]